MKHTTYVLTLLLSTGQLTFSQTPAAEPAKPSAKAKAEAIPPPVLPPLFDHWKVQFELGARNFDLYGDRPGKFLELRDIVRGAYVKGLDFRFESADSPTMFFIRGTNIRELDEKIEADFWQVRRLRTTFQWDRLPHFYSDGTSLFQSDSNGNLTVSPAIRGAFQAVVDGQTPQTVSPALYPLVRAELAAAPVSDLRIRRNQVSLRQSMRFGRLELHGQWKSVFSRGTRPKGVGTFARQNIGPGTPADGIWESIGVELPEPVRHRTDELTLGGLVSGKNWRLGFDYGFSMFHNDITTVTYENPFRVTDAAGNPPGSAVGRNRFVRQQNALAPNTDFHHVTIYAGFDLPRDTQVRGLFSWGRSTQNDAFVPFTMNTALVGTAAGLANNLPAGTSVLNVSSLPQRSLNGEVRTLNYDGTLVSKPWKTMNFRVQYRAEDMSNKTPRIVFPGQPRFGDSHWVNSADYYGLPIENFPTSFVRQDLIGSWRWDVNSRLSWNAEYQFETWKRTFREVPRSNEHSVNGRLDYKLGAMSSIKLDYKYSDREPEQYLTQPLTFSSTLNGWEVPRTDQFPQFQRGMPLEFSQLRRFDVTGRKQHDAKAAVDFRMGEKFSFSPSAHFLRNNYTKGFYGLTFDEMASVDAEVTYTAGERSLLFLNYSRQLDRYHARGLGSLITGSVVNGNPCCAQYPINNSWDRTSRSTLNFVQTGINWASNGEKTMIDLDYGFTFAKDRIHASNPYTIRADSPYTAGTYNYPDTKNGYQEVFLSLTRKLRPGLDLGLQYRFEAYQLDDFYLNALQAYPQGLATSGGLVSNLPRQLLLNARFTTYHAHQESFFVRYNF